MQDEKDQQNPAGMQIRHLAERKQENRQQEEGKGKAEQLYGRSLQQAVN
jgi:hypothetical protein